MKLGILLWAGLLASPVLAQETYEPSPEDLKTIRYLSTLKEGDAGKELKGDLFTGHRFEWSITKDGAHIYITRNGIRPTAWAWVDKDGESLPIPDLPPGEPREGQYMQGEVYTSADVEPGIGVVEISCPSESWLKGLQPAKAGQWGIESMAVIQDPDGYTNIRDEKGNVIAVVKEKEKFLTVCPYPGAKQWEAYLANGTQGLIHASRVQVLPKEPLTKLNFEPCLDLWKTKAKAEATDEDKRESVEKGDVLYFANLSSASEGDTEAMRRFYNKKIDDAMDVDYLPDGWRLLHVVEDEKFAKFLESLPPEERMEIAAMFASEWITHPISDGRAYLRSHFPASNRLLFPER